ncbi:hypothetical protein [Dactylosporangium sp. NPDC050588]|uniref:hypothetical protein n=1 Tax=Dactylosporangium sp. NPDC050588 TaxID=3157211 RepID=UPI0033DC1FF0
MGRLSGSRDVVLAAGALVVMLAVIVVVAQLSIDRQPREPDPGLTPYKVVVKLSRTA